jgi:hypothetical protein
MKKIQAAACLGAALTIIAGAGTAARAQQAGTANGNAVFVGGTPILRIRVGAGGLSPEQRAEQVQDRLNRLLSTGNISPDDVTVEGFGNEAVIRVKGQLFLTADWATARYNKTVPMALAEHWAARLRGSLPSLTARK